MKPGDISISFSGGHKLEIQKKIQLFTNLRQDLIKAV